LTGRRNYIGPYENARATVDAQIADLRQLTADNPRQQRYVEDFARLSKEKMSELQQTIDFADAGRRDDALALVNSDRGGDLMEQVRRAAQAGIVEQQRLLTERQAQLASALETRSLLIGLLTGGIIIVAGVAFYLLLRLQRVEPFVTMCAWSKTVQYGN